MTSSRQPVFAGTFYPSDKIELKNSIERYLSEATVPKFNGEIKALICPHAGYVYSGPTAAVSYKMIIGKGYKDVILLGPSHRMAFSNLMISNYQSWQTPLGEVETSPVQKNLIEEQGIMLSNEIHDVEHSLEVQLPFLQMTLKSFKITPLLTGQVDSELEMADMLNLHCPSDTLWIISSDLSHYLPYQKAIETDKITIEKILALDGKISSDDACGHSGITILIELAKRNGWRAKLLDYRNSADTAGDKRAVVGYASIIFYK